MSKFKVGDRVLHKDKGEIGEIVGDGERGWWSVALPSGTFSIHESRLSPEPQAEAVAGPAAVSGRKFKIGDRVFLSGTIDRHDHGCGRFRYGVVVDGDEPELARLFIESALAGPIEHGFITDATGAAVYPITQTKPDKVTLSDFNAENKYARELYSLDGERVMVDVYRVIDAFKVTDPAIQHAIKKLLMPGERGAKGAVQDMEEATFSIRQAIELVKQKGGN